MHHKNPRISFLGERVVAYPRFTLESAHPLWDLTEMTRYGGLFELLVPVLSRGVSAIIAATAINFGGFE